MSLIPVDEIVHFDVITSDPTDEGAAIDADSPPTFDVFEEATDTPILDDQAMTKRTSLTGNYRGSFTASAANGFEAGKWYSVVVTAAVGAKTGKCVAKNFRITPAESSAGVPKVDVTHWIGTAAATPTTAGVPEVDVTHFGGAAGAFSAGVPAVNATQISGDSTAADNLENSYDDTAGPVPWHGFIDQGTAQAATSTTIRFRAAAAFGDDGPIGSTVLAYGSTQGYWQATMVTDYTSSTDEATVSPAWPVTPSGTITYKVVGSASGGTALYDLLTHGTYGLSALKALIDIIEAQTDDIGTAGAGLTALASATNLATLAAYVDTEVAAIKAVTDLLPNGGALTSLATAANLATVAGYLDTEVAAIKSTTDKLEDTLEDQGGGVYGFTAAAVQESPTGGSAPTVAEIVDGVWDELLSGHVTADSAGAVLGDVATGTPPSADAIADEVQTRTIAAVTLVHGLATDAVTSLALAPDAVAEIQSGLATSDSITTLQTSVDDVPTVAELEAQTDAILAMLDDPRAEPGQGAPPASADLATKVDWLYKLMRNKKTNDGTETKFFADDGVTVDHKQATSESGGTVTKAEIVSGP